MKNPDFPEVVKDTNVLAYPPLSLYIHIPWCIRKCPYCDFNSHVCKSSLPEKEYINVLLEDFEREWEEAGRRPIESIFIGGGTPSLFSAQSINHLLTALEKTVSFTPDMEITMEANPGTFEQEKFAGFRAAGINRLSIGIQSFTDSSLDKLGRIHNSNEARNAVSIARKAGFSNINLDLMHGLPEQDIHMAMHDLSMAIAMEPEHISWYQLTIEPNTVFHSSPPTLPVDDVLWEIQETGSEYLQSGGFSRYEISAWCQKGKMSKHNMNYWCFGDYIGIGAGAHGKITYPEKQIIKRRWKLRMPSAYLSAINTRTAGEKILTPDELPLEFFMNSFRIKEGISSDLFSRYTGLPLSTIETSLETLSKKGLLAIENNQHLMPTEKGQRFLNDILAEFMP